MTRRLFLQAILVCVLTPKLPQEELAKARKTAKRVPTPTTADQFLPPTLKAKPQ